MSTRTQNVNITLHFLHFSDKGGFSSKHRRFMTVVRLTSPIATTTTTADKLITKRDSANKKQVLIFGGDTMTLGILFSIFYSCLNPFLFFFVKVRIRLTCSRLQQPPLDPPDRHTLLGVTPPTLCSRLNLSIAHFEAAITSRDDSK